MGGQVRLVHVTTLNAAVRVVSSRHCRVGAGILLPGVPAPFVYPLARVLCCRLLLSLLLSCVPLFCCLSGGYALSLGVAPCFLIVYAPAMRSVAYYALCWGCSCARLAARYCHVGRVVVCGGVARVGVWSVWRSARPRAGRVSISLVFFFEEATMPERGGASMLHSGSAPRVIE